jgi:gamma-glutamylcyclotransferase (GGCT)/AIG2-like uncharacterized protein YtfP
MTKLFVYGTLKRHYANHKYLSLTQSRFLGEATLRNYALFLIYGGVPAAIPYDSYKVKGELYEVTDKAMGYIDRLEIGYHKVPVKVLAGDTFVEALVYVGEVRDLSQHDILIADGIYKGIQHFTN